MEQIDAGLVRLQIITVLKKLRRIDPLLRRRKKLKIGQQRRLARAHVGEDHPGPLLARIRQMTDRISDPRATLRFSRHVDHASAYVVEPAVIDAPESSILHSSVAQVRSAMRAVQPQKSRPPPIVAKQDEVFA